VAAAVLLLAGCGYVGNPLPPALDIPQRTTDLAAAEYGSDILVQFTVPPMTTEGLVLKSVRSVDLYVGPPVDPWNTDAWGASAERYTVPAATPGPITFRTPAAKWLGKEVVIAVRAIGPKGKASDWSNLRRLPVAAPLAAPADFKGENQPNGIELKWRGSASHYRVFRATGDVQPELLAESDQPEYRDSQIEYGTKYSYYVQATEGELQQSETAGPIAVTAEDKFAPSAPAGVTVELGTNSVELSWERNTEPRFQGYNVYRSVDGGPFEKIAAVIVSPSYTDRAVEAGKKYRYQVTSVGVNALESARSEAVEITPR